MGAVPTHPHRPDDPLSNRRPDVAEVEAGGDFARRLLELVQPPNVIAIGRVAESVLTPMLGRAVPYVRHPANAGAAEFADGVWPSFSPETGLLDDDNVWIDASPRPRRNRRTWLASSRA